jgi:hypothetical protein
VTDETQEEEKYHWIVMFNRGGKIYTYLYRTTPHMTEVVKRYYAEHDKYPYRMWVIVDGEIQKVVIT